MEAFDLKRKLLLGAAVGGVRSDGAFPGHPWAEWCARTRPRDAEAFRAADHWENWRADAALMHSMTLQCCRYTVDWARIEPEEGRFDDEAIAHLRDEIIYMRAMGIHVVLVLHEFSEPVWFQRLGGWSKQDNISFFLAYTEKLLRTLGHLVDDYVPISQPNLYVWAGWSIGAWPPGKKTLLGTRQVTGVLCAAHIECYRLIHALRSELGLRDTRVGASTYMRMLRSKKTKLPTHLTGASALDKLFQTNMIEAMACGKFSPAIQNFLRIKKGTFCDFHDLCCYALPASMDGLPGAGHEVNADEVIYCAAQLSALQRRPIFITKGSGLAAPSPESVYDCVRAINEVSLPVEGCFELAFVDGFSFSRDGEPRIGLVAVNPEDGSRCLRPAGEFLTGLIRNRGVTEEMCSNYGVQKQA